MMMLLETNEDFDTMPCDSVREAIRIGRAHAKNRKWVRISVWYDRDDDHADPIEVFSAGDAPPNPHHRHPY